MANIHWNIEKAREFQKNIYFCFIDYDKAFDCVDHNKLWKILQEREYQTILPASWEICMQVNSLNWTTVRTGHGTTDWFRIGKGVCEGYILSPCLFNLYEEYIMWNVGLDGVQARIKIVGRNNNNLIYTDDTTLTKKSKEDLKSLDEGERE